MHYQRSLINAQLRGSGGTIINTELYMTGK